MKLCSKCNNNLSDTTKFCTHCGAKVESVDINENTDIITNSISSFKPSPKATSNKQPLKENIGATINNSKNKPKSNKFIIIVSIFVVISFIATLFLFKNPLLYKYYSSKASKSISIGEKLTNYNKALKYDYNFDIIDFIYDTLKHDSYFVDELSKVNNLKDEDKTNLIYKICILKADEAFNNEDYKTCEKYLNLAKEHGYNENDYANYNSLLEKLNEATATNNIDTSNTNVDNVYTFSNDNPSSLQGSIYDYSNDYIIYSSNSRYLSTSELRKYNKDTLALIRNEIFARHGYVFKTEPFKSYFRSKSWYTPDSSFTGSDSELNRYEIENIQTILSVEESK